MILLQLRIKKHSYFSILLNSILQHMNIEDFITSVIVGVITCWILEFLQIFSPDTIEALQHFNLASINKNNSK